MSGPKWLGLAVSVVLGFSAVNTLLAGVGSGAMDDWMVVAMVLAGSTGLAIAFVVGWVSASGISMREWWAGDGSGSE